MAIRQVKEKKVGNTQANPLQKVDYRYNIRGWLTDINDNALAHGHLFYFHLGYTDGANPLYNGNISQTIWKTRGDNTLRSYQYSYDKLNRLTQADYLNVSNNIADTYNVFIDYDKNGNIMHLHRNGGFENPTLAPAIDQLEYGYAANSNQLLNVSDATNDAQGFKDGNSQQTGDDYDYDAYGNMTKDQNKGITHITYNHMNLPVEIDFVNNRKITYLYTAMGTKLQKTIDYGSHQVVTDYCDGYQYETKPVAQGGRGYAELLFFPTAEGYVKALYKDDLNEKAPAAFQYIYIYKDHLGNNRLSYTLDPQTEQVKILEENHYYPFGLKHGSYNNTKKEVKYKEELAEKKEVKQVMADAMAFKYKYNGKELQDEFGLNVYDYGARIYEPAAPHFWQIDPLAEKYSFQSPYVYANDNPVLFVDIMGMGVDDLIFIFQGDSAKKRRYQKNLTSKVINDGLGGNYAKIVKGKLILNISKDQISNLTSEQKGFYDVINDAMTAENDVKINIVSNRKDIPVADMESSKVDIQDIDNFGTKDPVNNKYVNLGHEIKEQTEYQNGNPDYENNAGTGAHQIAEKAETSMNGGWVRGKSVHTKIKKTIIKESYKRMAHSFPAKSTTWTTYYSKGGKVISSSYTVIEGNVVKRE